MATYYIFIEDKKEIQEQIGRNACYVYADKMLKIYSKERLVYSLEARPGDAFAVMYENGKAILKKLVPPQRKGVLVAWLLNYQKHNRAESQREYQIKLAKYRDKYDW